MNRHIKIIFALMLIVTLFITSCANNSRDSDVTSSIDTTTADTTATPQISFTDESENGINVYKVKSITDATEINWYDIPAVAIDTYKWLECNEIEAYAQLVFVNGYGFICRMTAVEADPFTRYTEYGDPSCLDSCLEFFVTFDNERYLNIEANSGGALYVGIGSSRNDHTPADKIISTAEMIKVTPEVEEDKWMITIDLPIEKLEKLYGISFTEFTSGFTFGGNFYKTECADNGNEHYAMWNEVASDIPDFHRPDSFGKFIIE